MLHWYPKIKDYLRTPKTVFLPISTKDHHRMREVLDGKAIPKRIEKEILLKAEEIGYPLFLRSDQGSGKHEWRNTCYVPDKESLIPHIISLIEWHECAGIMGLWWDALVFREFLSLESRFKAFYGMPVSRERRVFVRDGVVECIHPYWPEDAICEDHENPLPLNWKEQLKQLNDMNGEEIGQLSYVGKIFGGKISGYWSVDFACDDHGSWWLIDAARGEISWHPSYCKHCPDEQKPQPTSEGSIIVKLANLGESE
jgi:hypothetical protein